MWCWRFDLKRKFVAYVDCELAHREVERIESHLLDCGTCRDRVVRLRDGLSAVKHLPRQVARRDSWDTIAAALANGSPLASPSPNPMASRRPPFSWRAAAGILAALTIVANAGVFAWQSGMWRAAGNTGAAGGMDPKEFHPVRISTIGENTEARIVAEGFVSDVSINPEDGDLMFRIVDDLQQPGPFIVCEVIPPIRLAAPAVGSRVRVYGVSRYDAKEQCRWHEIHPVLKIEVVTDFAEVHGPAE